MRGTKVTADQLQEHDTFELLTGGSSHRVRELGEVRIESHNPNLRAAEAILVITVGGTKLVFGSDELVLKTSYADYTYTAGDFD